MKRGTLGWFRYRMVSGVIFAVLGIGIAVRIVVIQAPFQGKLLGLPFALIAIGLGVVRVVAYLQIRKTNPIGPPQ